MFGFPRNFNLNLLIFLRRGMINWIALECYLRPGIPRRNRLQKFAKKGALKNLVNFTGKHVVIYFVKKRLQHRCFPEEFVNFLRTTFFIEQLRWLLLSTFRYSISDYSSARKQIIRIIIQQATMYEVWIPAF